jgi:hypothetical protein
MMRFALRHWTGILITIVLLWWALIYLPASPSFAVFQMKRAIDARDGDAAARYVDWESVTKNAGYEMLKQKANDPLSQMLGQGAIELFSKPLAQAARAYAVKDVNDGADDVQMPPIAVVGAMIMMHRDDGTAYTRFVDKKKQEWEVRMARSSDGVWQVTEVKNIQQLLEKLQRSAEKRYNQQQPPPPAPSP